MQEGEIKGGGDGGRRVGSRLSQGAEVMGGGGETIDRKRRIFDGCKARHACMLAHDECT